MTKPPARFSPHWHGQIKHMLLQGFGAEDIAIRLGDHPRYVRDEVKALRAAGVFEKWWGAARACIAEIEGRA